jgi:hypothetical protein
MSTSSPFADVITVVPWVDPVIDQLGLDPMSHYVEFAWLPRLGPSATWAYRRLTTGLRPDVESYELELAYLAHAIGLGTGTGANSPVQRSLRRLVCFGLARREGDSVVAVRRRAPWLNLANVRRLDPRLQRIHEAVLAGRHPATAARAS